VGAAQRGRLENSSPGPRSSQQAYPSGVDGGRGRFVHRLIVGVAVVGFATFFVTTGIQVIHEPNLCRPVCQPPTDLTVASLIGLIVGFVALLAIFMRKS
jgi:hypothetical protein